MRYELQIEDVNAIRRRLHFTISQDVIQSELDRAYRDLGKRVKLPGFRQGKVPRYLLESRFGKQVQGDISSRLVDESYRQAARDIEIAGQPTLENRGDLKTGQPFTFTIAVDVKPEISAHDYTGVQVDYRVRPVEDSDVETEVSRLLRGKTRIEEVVDDRPVQQGDLVLTSLKLADGDETLVDEAGTMVNTNEERYYPGVQPLLIGLRKDEERTDSVTIGNNSVFEHLRGRAVQATVKVLGIQAQVVPQLSDDLAGELSYEGGAEGMKAAIRMKIQASREEAARNQARLDLLQKLVDKHDFEVPSGMVEEQFQQLLEEMRVRKAYGGQDPRSIRFSDAEIEDYRSRARFAAKASCILAAVSRQENLAVTDADLDARIQEIANLRGQAVEAIRGYLEREGAFSVLRDRIQEEKTLEWLLENADLQDAPAEAPEAAPAAKAEEAPAEEAKKPAKKASKKAAASEDAEAAPAAKAEEAPSEEAPAKKPAKKASKKAAAEEEGAAEEEAPAAKPEAAPSDTAEGAPAKKAKKSSKKAASEDEG